MPISLFPDGSLSTEATSLTHLPAASSMHRARARPLQDRPLSSSLQYDLSQLYTLLLSKYYPYLPRTEKRLVENVERRGDDFVYFPHSINGLIHAPVSFFTHHKTVCHFFCDIRPTRKRSFGVSSLL